MTSRSFGLSSPRRSSRVLTCCAEQSARTPTNSELSNRRSDRRSEQKCCPRRREPTGQRDPQEDWSYERKENTTKNTKSAKDRRPREVGGPHRGERSGPR